MRICNGPQLCVPRPGREQRYSYWSRSYFYGAYGYDEYLARERARIRALPSVSVADCKSPATVARRVKLGESFRLVDGHGRSYGKRFDALCNVPIRARVRLVDRQPEDYHSLVSRMLKRAHRAAVREDQHTF